MQSGEQLITLVPTSAPLEVETRIAAAAGYVTLPAGEACVSMSLGQEPLSEA